MTVTPSPAAQPSTAKKVGVIVGTGFALLIWIGISAVLGVPGMILNLVVAVAVLVLGKRLPPITPRKTVVVMLVIALLIGFAGKAGREKAAKDHEVAQAQMKVLQDGERSRLAAIFTEAEAIHQRGDVKAALAKLNEAGDYIPDQQDSDRRIAFKNAWSAEIGGKFAADVDAAIAKARAAVREGRTAEALAALGTITGDALLAPNADAAIALKKTITDSAGDPAIKKILDGMTTLQLQALAEAGMTPEMAYHTDPELSAAIKAKVSASREIAAKIMADRATSAPWSVAMFTSEIPMLAERNPKDGAPSKSGEPSRTWSFKKKTGDQFTGFVSMDGKIDAVSCIMTMATIGTAPSEQMGSVMSSALSCKVISIATRKSLDEVMEWWKPTGNVDGAVIWNGVKVDRGIMKASDGYVVTVTLTPQK